MPQMTLAVRLDEETQARLKSLGEVRDRSPHYLMKAAIEAYLEKEEAVEAEKALIRARWDSFALTGETVSQSDMLDWARSLPEA